MSQLSKGGVYEARETVWAVCDGEERDLEAMEEGRDAA
jgi:hypothetical protein